VEVSSVLLSALVQEVAGPDNEHWAYGAIFSTCIREKSRQPLDRDTGQSRDFLSSTQFLQVKPAIIY